MIVLIPGGIRLIPIGMFNKWASSGLSRCAQFFTFKKVAVMTLRTSNQQWNLSQIQGHLPKQIECHICHTNGYHL